MTASAKAGGPSKCAVHIADRAETQHCMLALATTEASLHISEVAVSIGALATRARHSESAVKKLATCSLNSTAQFVVHLRRHGDIKVDVNEGCTEVCRDRAGRQKHAWSSAGRINRRRTEQRIAGAHAVEQRERV